MNSSFRNITIFTFFMLNLVVFAFSVSKLISNNISEYQHENLVEEGFSIEYFLDNNELFYSKSDEGLINISFNNQTIDLGHNFSTSIFASFDDVFVDGKPKDDKCNISRITLSRNHEMGDTFQERILYWDYCLENV